MGVNQLICRRERPEEDLGATNKPTNQQTNNKPTKSTERRFWGHAEFLQQHQQLHQQLPQSLGCSVLGDMVTWCFALAQALPESAACNSQDPVFRTGSGLA